MEEKKLFMIAIDHYSKYNKTTKSLLKILITLSVRNETIITVKKLHEIIGCSKTWIYNSIKHLEQDQYIKRNTNHNINGFIINFAKLKNIVEHYNLISSYSSSNKNDTQTLK